MAPEIFWRSSRWPAIATIAPAQHSARRSERSSSELRSRRRKPTSDAATNAIPNPGAYTNVTNPQTIWVRIYSIVTFCTGIKNFTV